MTRPVTPPFFGAVDVGSASSPVAADVVAALSERVRAKPDPERADREAAYLKSSMVHLGVSVPVGRAIVKDVLGARPALDRGAVCGIIDALWEEPEFEMRRAATEVAVANRAVFQRGDLEPIAALMSDAGTWAINDEWAIRVVGRIFQSDPVAVRADFDRWIHDENFWVRRAVILAYIPRIRSGEDVVDELGTYAEHLLGEREFFIRKAVGWAMRESARRHPESVVAWVQPRQDRMSGLTRREALRTIDSTLLNPVTT